MAQRTLAAMWGLPPASNKRAAAEPVAAAPAPTRARVDASGPDETVAADVSDAEQALPSAPVHAATPPGAAAGAQAPPAAPPPPPPPPDGGVNAYERQREERIARNLRVMADLGIQDARSALAPPPPATAARAKTSSRARAEPPAARAYPLRSRGAAAAAVPSAGAEDDAPAAAAEAEPAPVLHYDDSSVRRYVCAAATGSGAGSVFAPRRVGSCAAAATAPSGPPCGFARVRGLWFRDDALERTYAVDRHGPLLAAAGHGGRAAVWAAPASPAAEEEGEPSEYADENRRGGGGAASAGDDDDDDDAPPVAPLLSWRAHAGWVSAAALLGGGGTRLLTASNDKTVALWDLEKAAAGAPQRLDACAALHRGGVWSLHAPRSGGGGGGDVAFWTASKDGTTRLSALAPAGIAPGRSFPGHHRGVVRAVRARDAATAADGGADGDVCLLDARAPDAAAVAARLAAAHGGAAVSCLEWHPACEFTLLSAGADPAARLWDLRRPDAPAAVLAGHAAPHLARLRAVYRPAFVAAGAAVASPGEGSGLLSLYCAASGRALSRGALGHDPSVAFCGGLCYDDTGGGGASEQLHAGAPLLLAHGGALRVYAPQWE